MSQDDAKRSPSGRSALGGAACGLTYDGVTLDAMARESRPHRPLRPHRWQTLQDLKLREAAHRERLEAADFTPSR